MMRTGIRLIGFLLTLQFIQALNNESRYKFASKLFQEVGLNKLNENVIISPASVQTCLALSYMGAAGETAAELSKGLHFERFSTKEDVATDYNEFLKLSTKGSDSKLQMANRVYVDHKFDILPKYNEVLEKNFDAKAEMVNFGDNKKTAANINEWVELKTQHKIKNLVDASALNADTAAVLVNAIYFKAEWKFKFAQGYTSDRPFSTNEKETSDVPMMFRSGAPVRIGGLPALDARGVELPYENTDLKMLILLPNKVNGLHDLEQKLSNLDLLELSKKFKVDELDIHLPKFRIEFGLSLVETLKNMGMSTLFNEHADLSDMLKTSKPLKISNVIHKAYIEVNEQGSEAAGATFSQVTYRTGRSEEQTFRVDHPFLFAILDDHAVYFIGHIVKL